MTPPNLASLTRLALIEELEDLHRQVLHLIDPLTDQELWARPIEPGNSIGHLILHLSGNIQHYVGAQLKYSFKITNIYTVPLEITALSEDDLVMGLRHCEFPIEGVQFHPESILTEGGHAMLKNFLTKSRV